MEFLRTFLEQQLLLSMFLVIGLGYAIGQVNIRGFNLGVGAVLFVGLGVGMLAPKAAPPALLGSLGLVTPMLFNMLVGHFVLKLRFDDLRRAAARGRRQTGDRGVRLQARANRSPRYHLRDHVPGGDHHEDRPCPGDAGDDGEIMNYDPNQSGRPARLFDEAHTSVRDNA
jgi:hypothetical protein